MEKITKKTQKWISDSKKAYNIFRNLPRSRLYHLCYLSGLDMNHYKNKSLMAKGMLIRIGVCLPGEYENWK